MHSIEDQGRSLFRAILTGVCVERLLVNNERASKLQSFSDWCRRRYAFGKEGFPSHMCGFGYGYGGLVGSVEQLLG